MLNLRATCMLGRNITTRSILLKNALPVLRNVGPIRQVVLGTPLTSGMSTRARKIVGAWALGCAGMCCGAVILGGTTRLTESGLSMVDWHLIKGMRPPLTEKEWQAEFDKYKIYPEYAFKSGSREMTLDEFKFIWRMEWAHRMWGRSIGLAFFIPAGVFWAKKWFTPAMKKRVGIMGALLLSQGLIGWYMVKSGLNPQNNSDNTPRVSQYRLAMHLSSALVLYTLLLWTGLSHVLTPDDHTKIRGIGKLRGLAHATKTSLFLTAVAGAFVAGLDAGLVYNSWPKYADRWIPEDLWSKHPTWKNFFENATMTQFNHRNLAYVSLTLVTLTYAVGRRLPLGKRARMALAGLLVTGYAQVSLGIYTLLSYVPVYLGVMHQSGSLAVLSMAFWLTSELRRIPK